MKEEKNIEIKEGTQLKYAGKIVTVKEVTKTHLLISFEGGATFAVNKLGFERKHIVNQKL